MLKQFLAVGVLTAISGCTINITTEGPHEGFDHHDWHEEKEEWHHGHDHHDDGEWSGFITEHCWHSEAVREMAAGYCEGEYGAFYDLIDTDAEIMVNDVDFSKSEWIESFDEGKAPFDDVRHEDMVVTTMSYNNGRMFTNMWYTWKGVVKETGEELSIRGYAAFEWDGERVVGFYNAFDPTDYNGA